MATGGGGYDVRCGKFLYQGGAVCRTVRGIELQVAAGWRECVGDVKLILWIWRLPSGVEGNFFHSLRLTITWRLSSTKWANNCKFRFLCL